MFDDSFLQNAKYLLNEWEQEYASLLTNPNEGFQPGNAINDVLNLPIGLEEIGKVIRHLKKRKSVGLGNVPNEILQSKQLYILLHKLFSKVFEKGLAHALCKNSIISPISKKGKDTRIPMNTKGLSLISTICKCFTAVINNRLTSFLEENDQIADQQNGFRRMRATIDHIYVLISVLKERKKEMMDTFCAFIDFSHAFDGINHDLLWQKLLQYGIDEKIYRVIKALYQDMSSMVRLNGMFTEAFPVPRGVHQGDNMSSTLFSIYINDLLYEINILGKGVYYGNTMISVLAYADDLVFNTDTDES